MFSKDNSVEAGHQCVGCVCPSVCTEEQGRRPAAPAQTRREGRRRKGSQCSFCLSPNPQKTKNNATLQWATIACYIIAMAPQQAK